MLLKRRADVSKLIVFEEYDDVSTKIYLDSEQERKITKNEEIETKCNNEIVWTSTNW